MTVNILQAFLIGLIYYFYDCPWFPNIGYTIFSKPLVIGPLVGLILGDVATGLQVGISIQLIYMGVIVAGGSMPSDTALAGAVGSALAIMLKPTMGDGAIDAALTMAVALGMVGTMRFVARMTWCSFFNRLAEKAASKGDLKGLSFWNLWMPQICLAILSIVPVAAFVMAMGSEAVLATLNTVFGALMGPLGAIGKLLPCVGIALLLSTIGNKKTIPIYVIGFIFAKCVGLTTIQIAIVAALIAYLMIFVGGDKKSADAEEAEALPELE